MTLIPYPNVPAYPGVPPIPRTAPGSPAIDVALANPQEPAPAQTQSVSYAEQWGIYNSVSGKPLYKPVDGGTLSFFSLAYVRRMQISDFPIEANASGQGAAFASFNKVWQPANPIVTLALSGPDSDLTAFLAALDAACISTELYSVVTPDAAYVGYSIESYSYQRTAQRGATMLMVEISLKQILQVQPSYSEISNRHKSPQSPSAGQSGKQRPHRDRYPESISLEQSAVRTGSWRRRGEVMAQTIPLQPVPSQTLQVVLDGQQCAISVYMKNQCMFFDLRSAGIRSPMRCRLRTW